MIRSRGRGGRCCSWARSVTVLLLSIVNPAVAGQTRSIELSDGSVIVGEILTVEHGIYTVRTQRLGVLSLRDADIATIRPWNQTLPSPPAPAGNAELAAIQRKIVMSPGLLPAIKALQGDPEIQQILSDPELLKALTAGDLETLQAHPKIQNLTQHPAFQNIFRTLSPP